MPLAYVFFLDIDNKFSQYIGAGIKKTIKKHCFNKENWRHISLRVQGYLNFREQRLFVPNTITARTLDALEVTLAWSEDNSNHRQHTPKNIGFITTKSNLADVWWPKGMHLTGAVYESLNVSSTFCSAVSTLLSTQGLPISSWGAKVLFSTKSRFMKPTYTLSMRGQIQYKSQPSIHT